MAHFIHHFNLIFILTSTLIISVISGNKQICDSEECKQAAQYLKSSMNIRTRPCSNFHQYTCANWGRSHSQYVNVSQLRIDRHDLEILDYLNKKNNGTNEPKAIKKAKQVFSLCLRNDAFNGGRKSLNNALESITRIEKRAIMKDYSTAVAKASRLVGVHIFFEITVLPDPKNNTKNMIWILKPSRHRLLQGYFNPDLFEENTEKDDSPKKIYKNYLKMIEGPRLQSAPTIFTLQDLHYFSENISQQIHSSVPKFNWTRYIEEMFTDLDVSLDFNNPNKFWIAIDDLNFIKEMLTFIYELNNVEKIEYIIRQEVTKVLEIYTGKTEFEQFGQFAFNRRIDRSQSCIKLVSSLFPIALSYMYIKDDKYNEARFQIYDIFLHVQNSLEKIIRRVSWMDINTKERALKKLASIKSLVAYCKAAELTSIMDQLYEEVDITGNILETVIKLNKNAIEHNLKSVNRRNDPKTEKWFSSLSSSKLVYLPQRNTITIPASLIGIPYFYKDAHALKALNYGSIGFLIAREMIHGFDDLGREYNEKGNIENWWSRGTFQKYTEKAKCFIDADHEKYKKANSTSTLREDISDHGAFKIALFAYRNHIFENGDENLLTQFEGFTHEQLFTLGFAGVSNLCHYYSRKGTTWVHRFVEIEMSTLEWVGKKCRKILTTVSNVEFKVEQKIFSSDEGVPEAEGEKHRNYKKNVPA
ncbi:neprilysin-1-like [Planococcus citri]|uniref:neprilysin-1-like n=1 Tax=Planococcus citri TaxID=170843 RepID=UPI0031FA2886